MTANKPNEVSEQILKKYYPNILGAILTGSQKNISNVQINSDIDLVVFDTLFSGISSEIIEHENLKIDVTRVSLTDIYSILIDEAYDLKGLILHMIITGNIIKDNNDIISDIQLLAGDFYNGQTLNYEKEWKGIINGLQQVKKGILKEKGYKYDFFLINQFTDLISSAFLLNSNGWVNKGKHRVDDLIRINPDFINDLVMLSKSFINYPDENRLNVIKYIDSYTEVPASITSAISLNKKTIVEIWYEDFSYTHCIEEVIPEFLKSLFLKFKFEYYSSVSFKNRYIFKYNFYLVFKATETAIIIDELINFSKNAGYEISLKKVNSFFKEKIIPDSEIDDCFSKILHFLSISLIDKKFNYKLAFLSALNISIIFTKYLFNQNYSLSIHALNYLSRKWAYSSSYNNISYDGMMNIYNDNQKIFNEHYLKNSGIFESLFKATWSNPNKLKSGFLDFKLIDILIKKMSIEIKNSKDQIPGLSKKVILTFVKNAKEALYLYYYSSFLEEVFGVLNIKSEDYGFISKILAININNKILSPEDILNT